MGQHHVPRPEAQAAQVPGETLDRSRIIRSVDRGPFRHDISLAVRHDEPVIVRPVTSCSPDQLAHPFAAGGWPAFIDADERAALALPRVRDLFAEHELAVVEGEHVLAAGWGVPLVWTGSPDDLPDGYTDALHRALDDHDRGRHADTFVLAAIQVHPEAAGRGVAARLVTALVEHAEARGLAQVIAPRARR